MFGVSKTKDVSLLLCAIYMAIVKGNFALSNPNLAPDFGDHVFDKSSYEKANLDINKFDDNNHAKEEELYKTFNNLSGELQNRDGIKTTLGSNTVKSFTDKSGELLKRQYVVREQNGGQEYSSTPTTASNSFYVSPGAIKDNNFKVETDFGINVSGADSSSEKAQIVGEDSYENVQGIASEGQGNRREETMPIDLENPRDASADQISSSRRKKDGHIKNKSCESDDNRMSTNENVDGILKQKSNIKTGLLNVVAGVANAPEPELDYQEAGEQLKETTKIPSLEKAKNFLKNLNIEEFASMTTKVIKLIRKFTIVSDEVVDYYQSLKISRKKEFLLNALSNATNKKLTAMWDYMKRPDIRFTLAVQTFGAITLLVLFWLEKRMKSKKLLAEPAGDFTVISNRPVKIIGNEDNRVHIRQIVLESEPKVASVEKQNEEEKTLHGQLLAEPAGDFTVMSNKPVKIIGNEDNRLHIRQIVLESEPKVASVEKQNEEENTLHGGQIESPNSPIKPISSKSTIDLDSPTNEAQENKNSNIAAVVGGVVLSVLAP